MNELTFWLAVNVVAWSYNLVIGARLFADWLRWREFDAYMRDHPTGVIANLTPPTMTELGTPAWVPDISGRTDG